MAEEFASSSDIKSFEELFDSHIKCINFRFFENTRWAYVYTKFQINIINVLETYDDNISRLYLMIRMVYSFKDIKDLINELSAFKLKKFPIAVELTKNIKDIFPNADPIYLDIVGEMYAFDEPGLIEFIDEITTSKRSYPKKHEYNESIKKMKLINRLWSDFNIHEYLSICPDPVKYFKNKDIHSCKSYKRESLHYLCDTYYTIPYDILKMILRRFNFHLTDAYEYVSEFLHPVYRSLPTACGYFTGDVKASTNIEFLKEMVYIDNMNEISNHFEHVELIRRIDIELAKVIDALKTCECCYDSEVIEVNVRYCPAGHTFCTSCITKGVEIAAGESKIAFKCFADCTEEFNSDMIKNCISTELYQRVMSQKQIQVMRATKGNKGLETCAFCDYFVILPSAIKIINCLNPECSKQTCRICREESHVPYKCDEINSEIQARTLIENKMTEVLIRTCFSCNRKIVKEGDCNWINCICGKNMCYICRAPVPKWNLHFYGQNEKRNKCPFFLDNNIIITAVEAVARLTLISLKAKKPEFTPEIKIRKILPPINESGLIYITKNRTSFVNNMVSRIIGERVKDINNIENMRSLLEPWPPWPSASAPCPPWPPASAPGSAAGSAAALRSAAAQGSE